MKKLSIAIIAALLLCFSFYMSAQGGPGISSPGGSGSGVLTDTNCNQAKYFPIGTLCQDTDDGKLWKGITSGITEVTSGSAAGDMIKNTYDTDNDGKVDALDITASAQLFVDSSVTPAFINSISSGASNFLTGVTPAYVNTLTSDAQAQIAAKQAADADLTTYAGITPSAGAQLFLASGVTPVFLNALGSISGVSAFLLSSVTATYINTVTSDVQAQIAGRQALDADLTALAGLTTAADKVPYFTGAGSASVTDLSAVGRGIIQSGTTGAARVAIGVAYGSGSANFAFTNGDLVDMSGVTMTAGVDEGIALPWYANVAPATEKFYMAYDSDNNALMVREAGGWVNVGASAAAPTTAQYIVGVADGNLTAEKILTAGTGIDVTLAGGDAGTATVDFDSTEIGTTTWGSGSAIVWTFNASAGTDPAITFGDGSVNISTGKLLSGGTDVYVSGATDVYVTDGGTGKSSWTQYALIYPNTTTSFSQIAVGTSGQILRSGGAAAPGWSTATYPATSGTSSYFLRSDGTNIVSTSHSLTLDDIADGSSFQRVAAADVSASGHVNRWQVADTAGYATIAGPTGAIVITVDDAAQTLAARNRDNTFTENNTFGNANTDTLTIQSLIVGSGRAVTIASSSPSPTYATGTTEFYVQGDIECGGTAYSAGGFISTGAGDSYLSLTNNAAYNPSSGYQLYFEAGTLKVYDGTEKALLDTASAPTLTGTSWSFASVTNLVIPHGNSATADATGEIAFDDDDDRFVFQISATQRYFDFTGDAVNYVLKSDGAGHFTLQADETGTTPYWSSLGNPTAALALTMDSGETTAMTYTGAFTATQGSQFLIEQKTGNPTGGVMFEVKVADTDVTAVKIGDGTNAILFSNSGGMTLAGTASVTAGGIILGDSTPDANGEFGYSVGQFLVYGASGVSITANSEDLGIISTAANLWKITSSTGAKLEVTPEIRFTSGVTMDSPLFLNGHVYPGAADSYNLGSGTSEFANLYLGDGAIIYGQNDQSATLTSAASLWTANNFSVDTQFKLPSSDAAPTATAGYIRHDSTVTNYTGGAIVYSSGTTPFQIVAMPSAFAAICSDGQFVAYDGTLDYWKCVSASGTGDFKADGSVPMTAAIVPNAVNTIALGSAAAEWSDLYLGDGAIIYGQNDSSATLTSSASLWTANNFTVAAAGALTIPQSATPTVDAVGEIAFDTTASQLVSYSGTTEIVLGGVTEFVSFTVSGVTDVAPDDDHYLLDLPYNITLKQVSAIQRRNAGSTAAGVPTTINIQECTSALSCTDMIATDWILSGSTTAWVRKGVGDFSDSVGTRGNSLKLDIVSGASNSDLTVTIMYWINRE